MKLTKSLVRKIAVAKQQLSGTKTPATTQSILNVFRSLGYIQLDPIRAVERTQFLVLWSRLGNFDLDLLHRVQFDERQLIEYWAHAASIMMVENFPIHRFQMENRPNGSGAWAKKSREWLEANTTFRDYIREEIKQRGMVDSRDLEDRAVVPWESSGWSSGKNVTRMIDFMWSAGELTVADRRGLQRKWSYLNDWLPSHTPQEQLSAEEVSRRATEISLKALGVATAKQIRTHFVRGYYSDQKQTLSELVSEHRIIPVEIDSDWKDQWYLHADDLPLIESFSNGGFEPRTVLLSPFDNLIIDRERTEMIWDFYYRMEIYVPKAKRQYGYYVLPILHGDQLIGRIAPRMDRKTGKLAINGVYAEKDAPQDLETVQAIRQNIDDIAAWIGANEIVWNADRPMDFPVA